jgi:hypothetical protein
VVIAGAAVAVAERPVNLGLAGGTSLELLISGIGDATGTDAAVSVLCGDALDPGEVFVGRVGVAGATELVRGSSEPVMAVTSVDA